MTGREAGSALCTSCGAPRVGGSGATNRALGRDKTTLLDQLKLMPTWSNHVSLVAQAPSDNGSTGSSPVSLIAWLQDE
jgi:hypothetical protein